MHTIQTLKYAGIGAVGAAFLAAASPAAAGRCGHSYPVDAPTTLEKVARECNVNLSALYEANPGVDPRNVRPGQYLAVPDEIDRFAILDSTSAIGQNDQPAQNGASIVSSDYRAPITDDTGLDDYGRIANGRDEYTRSVQRIRFRDTPISELSTPLWLREESLGARRHSTADRLSYQQLSALRIQNAGLPSAAPRFAGASTPPGVQLIECPVLRKSDGGKIHKVRKIISTPESTFVEINVAEDGEGFDCRLINTSAPIVLTPGVPAAHYNKPAADAGYRLPDYSKIGDLPTAPRLVLRRKMALRGEIVDSSNGCLTLKTGNGALRKLSTTQPAGDLVGKEVTVWGTATSGGACGAGASLLVSHAVYAERWPAQ